MRTRLGKITVLMLALVLAVGTMGAGFAAFTDEMLVEGSVNTATVTYEVVSWSETWVYKDLTTRGMQSLPAPSEDPNLMLISWAKNTDWDPATKAATFEFANVFPCTDFCADALIHYTGSIPAHLKVDDLVWASGEELAPFMQVKFKYLANGSQTWVDVAEDEIQLHYCDHLEIIFCLHIPKTNDLQGLSGACSTELLLYQWNDPDCFEVVKILDLPDYPVHLTVVSAYNTPDGYCDATFSQASGQPAPPGWLLDGNPWFAWCCENENADLKSLPVTLMSSLDDEPYKSDPAWNYVNYILNQPGYWNSPYDDYPDNYAINLQGKNVYAGSPMQVAFWHFLFDWDPPLAETDAWAIIDDAEANGVGFMPGSGQLAAVICQDGDTYQTVFIAVDP